ncbi:hypothetical protein [Agrobacterium tumefaciens]|uniref:hypothetical protein n=1 Tax=Agrobacterium tumefaciens TaxID=358 RepID=UPI00287F26E6|nr:hypothetical protein [Agrobacterium tumefaciens]MDS7595443.1 hypothetical protein [Agrobacterium tumefaciens]
MSQPDKDGERTSASLPLTDRAVNSQDIVPAPDEEELLEEALEETFPASDPISSLRFT